MPLTQEREDVVVELVGVERHRLVLSVPRCAHTEIPADRDACRHDPPEFAGVVATPSLGGDGLEDVHVARLERRVQRRDESGDHGADEDRHDDRGAERELGDHVVGDGE